MKLLSIEKGSRREQKPQGYLTLPFRVQKRPRFGVCSKINVDWDFQTPVPKPVDFRAKTTRGIFDSSEMLQYCTVNVVPGSSKEACSLHTPDIPTFPLFEYSFTVEERVLGQKQASAVLQDDPMDVDETPPQPCSIEDKHHVIKQQEKQTNRSPVNKNLNYQVSTTNGGSVEASSSRSMVVKETKKVSVLHEKGKVLHLTESTLEIAQTILNLKNSSNTIKPACCEKKLEEVEGSAALEKKRPPALKDFRKVEAYSGALSQNHKGTFQVDSGASASSDEAESNGLKEEEKPQSVKGIQIPEITPDDQNTPTNGNSGCVEGESEETPIPIVSESVTAIDDSDTNHKCIPQAKPHISVESSHAEMKSHPDTDEQKKLAPPSGRNDKCTKDEEKGYNKAADPSNVKMHSCNEANTAMIISKCPSKVDYNAKLKEHLEEIQLLRADTIATKDLSVEVASLKDVVRTLQAQLHKSVNNTCGLETEVSKLQVSLEELRGLNISTLRESEDLRHSVKELSTKLSRTENQSREYAEMARQSVCRVAGAENEAFRLQMVLQDETTKRNRLFARTAKFRDLLQRAMEAADSKFRSMNEKIDAVDRKLSAAEAKRTIAESEIAQKVKAMKKKRKRDCEEQCVICISSPISIVLVPCGHKSLCGECGSKVTNCPICRHSIRLRLRSYDSGIATHVLAR